MLHTKTITIGTRGSDLALWQARHIKSQLNSIGKDVQIEVIKTKGDRIQDMSFDKMEGKGFFTKEIEVALLNHDIDLAVHSHKDLETTPPEGLMVSAVSSRGNPCELLLIRKEMHDADALWELKKDAVIGTSAARRKSQLLALQYPNQSILQREHAQPNNMDYSSQIDTDHDTKHHGTP